MSGDFIWGVLLVTMGLLVCLAEIIWEPWFVKGSHWVQLACLTLLVLASDLFLINVVFQRAPLDILAYVPPGGHVDKMLVGGIEWDSHLTDLRVAISNPSAEDYQNVDVVMVPDNFTYRASLLEGDCNFSEVPGNVVKAAKTPIKTSTKHTFTAVPVGGGFETYDNVGNEYVTVASQSGHRLICRSLPAHSTVKLVFALEAFLPQYKPTLNKRGPKGGFEIDAAAYAGVQSIFDLMGEKPTTKTITARGRFTKNVKQYSVELQVAIAGPF